MPAVSAKKVTLPDTHVGHVRDLLDVYVVCRTYGHSWTDDNHASYETIFNWTVALRCERCGTTKIEAMNNVGEVIYRRYQYPPQYKVSATRQGERVSRAAMRVELMRRQVLARRRPGKAPKMPTRGTKLVVLDGGRK